VSPVEDEEVYAVISCQVYPLEHTHVYAVMACTLLVTVMASTSLVTSRITSLLVSHDCYAMSLLVASIGCWLQESLTSERESLTSERTMTRLLTRTKWVCTVTRLARQLREAASDWLKTTVTPHNLDPSSHDSNLLPPHMTPTPSS